jgi:hypothetical protein
MPPEIPPTFTLSCEQTEAMRRPLVYIRRRLSDGKALYIGSSVDGLSRPLARTHEKARLGEGEVLEIYLTDTPRELEARFILSERPELNYSGPNSSVHSSVKAALYCAVCERPLSGRHGRTIFCSTECQKAAREAPRKCQTLREKLWAAQKAQDARAPFESALRSVVGRLEDALEESRKVLWRWGGNTEPRLPDAEEVVKDPAKELGLVPEDLA